LKKTGHNKFAGYYYFELGDFLPQIQQIFFDLKLCGIVSYGKEMAQLLIIDTESEGSKFIEISSPMSEAALKGCHAVQNLGAVETYIRRYLWVTALEIVEHDALDATMAKDAPKSAKSVPRDVFDAMTPEEQDFLSSHAKTVSAILVKGEVDEAKKYLQELNFDADEKVAIWSLFDSKERAALDTKRSK
jgi:hypothetical protein